MSAITVAVSGAHNELRDFYGRGMNLKSDVYRLPADANEHERLTLQHRIWKYAYRKDPGLYPPSAELRVQELLSPISGGRQPSILDVGTGSGIWAIEMAATFPQAKVIGLDLAMPQLKTSLANCSFVTADVMEADLEEYANSFDIVHSRCVLGHIIEKENFVRKLAKVLKPGGLLVLGDGDNRLYTPTGEPIPLADTNSIDDDGNDIVTATNTASSAPDSASALSNSTGTRPSWLARWLFEAVSSTPGGKSLDEDVGSLLRRIGPVPASAYGGEAESIAAAGSDIKLFRECHYETYLVPGVFLESVDNESAEEREKRREVTKNNVKNFTNFVGASKPTLLASGIPQQKLEAWSARVYAEMHEGYIPWYGRWHAAWGTKI